MTSTDWIEIFRRLPREEQEKMSIVLKNGTELCVDTIVRYEPTFLVLRGRQGGTIEEARGFFVPYDYMLCLRLDRIVKVEELDAFFGGPVREPEVPLTPPSAQPTPVAPTDPAAASRLLLDRIKSARENSVRFASRQI